MCFVNMRYITYEELTRIIFILLYALKLRYITYEELTHENNKKMVAMVLRYITYEELTLSAATEDARLLANEIHYL